MTQVPSIRKSGWVAIAVSMLCMFEGITYVAKHERIDPPGVITVCIGMTNYDRPIFVGQRFTKEQCKKFLAEDLPRYNKCIEENIHVALPPYRHAALVSFVYNLGCHRLVSSHIAAYLNDGNVRAACDKMLRYVYANGVKLRGLVRRRRFERKYCLRND